MTSSGMQLQHWVDPTEPEVEKLLADFAQVWNAGGDPTEVAKVLTQFYHSDGTLNECRCHRGIFLFFAQMLPVQLSAHLQLEIVAFYPHQPRLKVTAFDEAIPVCAKVAVAWELITDGPIAHPSTGAVIKADELLAGGVSVMQVTKERPSGRCVIYTERTV